MKKFRIILIVLPAAVAVLLMAACGAKDAAGHREARVETTAPLQTEKETIESGTADRQEAVGDTPYEAAASESQNSPAGEAPKEEPDEASIGGPGAPGAVKEDSPETAEVFAELIQEAVADRDMEAMAKLLTYPCTLKDVDGESVMIDGADSFLKLNPDQVFGDDLMMVIANVDTASLNESGSKVIMGDPETNIVLQKEKDGEMGVIVIDE